MSAHIPGIMITFLTILVALGMLATGGTAAVANVLGYPVGQWLGDAEFWPRIIHPDDRDRFAFLAN